MKRSGVKTPTVQKMSPSLPSQLRHPVCPKINSTAKSEHVFPMVLCHHGLLWIVICFNESFRHSIYIRTVAQSICTHYSCFENQGRFVTLKKNRAPSFLKKAGCKKLRSLLFKKRKDQAASFLFE